MLNEKTIAGTFRNTGTGHQLINDSTHEPSILSGEPSVLTGLEGHKLKCPHPTGSLKIGSLIAAPDETFASYGMIIGASVGLEYSVLRASLPLRFRTYGKTTVADTHPLFGSRVSIAPLTNGTGFVATVPQMHSGGNKKPVIATTHYIDGRAGDVQVTALTDTTFNVISVCDLDANIAYNAASESFDITTDNVLSTFTAAFATDTLTVTHNSTGRAALGVFLTQVFGGLKPLLVSSNASSFSLKFVNDAGVVQTSLSSAFKFRFMRPHKLPCLMPDTQSCYIDCGRSQLYWVDIISTNGNIWMLGMMHD